MEFSRVRLLYQLVSHNQRLQTRRHPMFEKNMAMKILSYIFIAFWAVYLVMLGFTAYSYFEGSALEAFDWVDGGMIWFLIIDFLSRFSMQETPAQNIKQYKLHNIPTGFLLHTFLLRMGLQPYNLFWAFFYNALAIPIAAGAFFPSFGIKLTRASRHSSVLWDVWILRLHHRLVAYVCAE